jgi:poly(beta-D-mannuronate) lyase
METGRPDALACALQWYDKWADAKALLGDAPNHTGRSVRKWTLASASAAWVKLKFSSSKPLADHADEEKKVEDWLSQIGDKVKEEWSPNESAHIFNNHFYWAGWAEMATAVATNRRDLFDQAVKIYDRFASQVDSEGYLPNELGRKTRALGYHLFAIQPLSMIAAFAQANGVDLASRGNHALKRLAERTLQGFDNPEMFEQKAGARQVVEGFDEQSSKLAWLEPYCSVEKCTGNAEAKLEKSRPFKNTRLGGDVTSVFSEAKG